MIVTCGRRPAPGHHTWLQAAAGLGAVLSAARPAARAFRRELHGRPHLPMASPWASPVHRASPRSRPAGSRLGEATRRGWDAMPSRALAAMLRPGLFLRLDGRCSSSTLAMTAAAVSSCRRPRARRRRRERRARPDVRRPQVDAAPARFPALLVIFSSASAFQQPSRRGSRNRPAARLQRLQAGSSGPMLAGASPEHRHPIMSDKSGAGSRIILASSASSGSSDDLRRVRRALPSGSFCCFPAERRPHRLPIRGRRPTALSSRTAY